MYYLSGSRLARLDEDALRVAHKRAVLADVLVHPGERPGIPRDGEPRHGSQHLAQEVDDGADVEELDPQRLLAQVSHYEAGGASRGLGP